MSFSPVSQDLFFSRNDLKDPRLGEWAHGLSRDESFESKKGVVIAGYPDDEGIELNGGRTGAAQAPDAIRRFFYKMTPSLNLQNPLSLWDQGNLQLNGSIEDRHKAVRIRAKNAFGAGLCWVGLGGGHDYGYPDAAAFLDIYADQNPLIINFDAHLDVRPLDYGLSSGTPFYRLLNESSSFDFAQIGIQDHCNSLAHFNWCKEKGARILTLNEILLSGESLPVVVTRFLEDWILKKRPTFISIDIDGFSSNFAMGCSQSWSTGFEPNSFFQLFQVLLHRLDVKGLGIYEVSPPLDQDDRTSKLAAQILHQFVHANEGNSHG